MKTVFKYKLPLSTLVPACFFYLLLIHCLITQTQHDYFLLVTSVFFFVGLSLAIYTSYLKPRKICFKENELLLKKWFFLPWQMKLIRYHEILSASFVTDSGFYCQLKTKDQTYELQLLNLNKHERKKFLELLESKLTHLSPLPTQQMHSILELHKELPAEVIMWHLTPSILSLMYFSYFDRSTAPQIEYSGYGNPIFILALTISIWINRKFVRAYQPQRKVDAYFQDFSPIWLTATIMLFLCPITNYINQKLDKSFATKTTARVVISSSSKASSNETKCFELQDDFLTDAKIEQQQVCNYDFPEVNQEGEVEVRYKQGYLGQRWIASIKPLPSGSEK